MESSRNARLESIRSVRIVAVLGAVLLVGISTLGLWSDVVAEESVSLLREGDDGRADAPSSNLILRVPASTEGSDDPGDARRRPPVEPAAPTESEEPKEEGPTFFGEPLTGSFVWLLDASESMGISAAASVEDYDGNILVVASRLDVLKIECVKALRKLKEHNEFDIIEYSMPKNEEPVRAWKGALVKADGKVRAAAIDYVKGMTPRGLTPTYLALEAATSNYGHDIDNLIFLTDGLPTVDRFSRAVPYGEREPLKGEVLAEFPGWFAPLRQAGCKLTCFQIGQQVGVGDFVQQLAAQNGGEFRKVQ